MISRTETRSSCAAAQPGVKIQRIPQRQFSAGFGQMVVHLLRIHAHHQLTVTGVVLAHMPLAGFQHQQRIHRAGALHRYPIIPDMQCGAHPGHAGRLALFISQQVAVLLPLQRPAGG